jgi:3-oxoacyl-[acyl-carrier protein] reductase
MFDLTGKRALVTGASGGIGREIAKALAAAGATVALSGTRVAALEAHGSLDILVNNAGVTRDNLFMRMKDEEWDEVIAVNLTAAFHLNRAVLRGMMKQRFGRIIGISSVVGVMGNPGQGNYAASKAGLIAMNKALAHEVASRNITVNSIAPGFIASAMTDELNDKQRESILSTIPTNRLGTPQEVAACAVFLASNEAAYVTGHTINVNGGMAMI